MIADLLHNPLFILVQAICQIVGGFVLLRFLVFIGPKNIFKSLSRGRYGRDNRKDIRGED